jgi:hypothetical protein
MLRIFAASVILFFSPVSYGQSTAPQTDRLTALFGKLVLSAEVLTRVELQCKNFPSDHPYLELIEKDR